VDKAQLVLVLKEQQVYRAPKEHKVLLGGKASRASKVAKASQAAKEYKEYRVPQALKAH
jgi:hypothetical protein